MGLWLSPVTYGQSARWACDWARWLAQFWCRWISWDQQEVGSSNQYVSESLPPDWHKNQTGTPEIIINQLITIDIKG